MFRNLITNVRRWLYKLGLLKGIKQLDDKKDIDISEKMYKYIDTWKQLYQGYHEPFHKVTYHTVQGGLKTRTKDTLNMPKVASSELASLVFNERCQINFSDNTLADQVNEVLDQCGFRKDFERYLEYMFALGGLVVKGHVADGKIKLSYVNADSFIPTGWTNRKVSEGIFVNETIKGDKRYTHLEWHYWYKGMYYIKHELFEAEKHSGELGIKVPVAALYPDIKDEEFELKNVKCSLFTYIKPNSANNVDLDSPLGVSIFANALHTINAIDTAFDSFHREFVLGKKRILVPETAIRQVIDKETGQMTRYFDADDEVYQAFKFGDDADDVIKDMSVELRVDEHIAAINALLNLFAMQIGFSAGSFSFDGQSMKTATEVVSENSKTFRTKQSHETIIEESIKDIVEIIITLSELYELGTIQRPEDYEITVTFDDSVAEDKMGDLQYWTQLVTNKLASKQRAMFALLGLTEEEAFKEQALIVEEDKQIQPETIDFFGMNSDEKA